MNAVVGGSYRMSFIIFNSGTAHAFGGTYREIVPGVRLRYTDKFEDPNMLATLAEAYFGKGDVAQAIATQELAVSRSAQKPGGTEGNFPYLQVRLEQFKKAQQNK